MIRLESDLRSVLRDLALLARKHIPAASVWGLRAAAKRIQRRMQEPGQPVRYPIQWDSVRQRQAYFASNGFGQGIPYRRRGRYEQGWKLKANPDGAELRNSARSAPFVGGLPSGRDLSPGKKQSSIHRGRWPLLRRIVDEEIKQLPDDVIERLRLEASK
jgi:hypothetical protein